MNSLSATLTACFFFCLYLIFHYASVKAGGRLGEVLGKSIGKVIGAFIRVAIPRARKKTVDEVGAQIAPYGLESARNGHSAKLRSGRFQSLTSANELSIT